MTEELTQAAKVIAKEKLITSKYTTHFDDSSNPNAYQQDSPNTFMIYSFLATALFMITLSRT